MINFDILNEFNDIYKKPFTFYEISLNTFFIIILGIISYIIYWSFINYNLIKYTRCKSNLKSLENLSNNYVVYTNNNNNNKLYSISYDATTKNANINCECPAGNTVNDFTNIKIYDNATNKTYLTHKTCMCDNNYTEFYKPSNVYYTGEPFLIKYMTDYSDDNSIANIRNFNTDDRINPAKENTIETTTIPLFP